MLAEELHSFDNGNFAAVAWGIVGDPVSKSGRGYPVESYPRMIRTDTHVTSYAFFPCHSKAF